MGSATTLRIYEPCPLLFPKRPYSKLFLSHIYFISLKVPFSLSKLPRCLIISTLYYPSKVCLFPSLLLSFSPRDAGRSSYFPNTFNFSLQYSHSHFSPLSLVHISHFSSHLLYLVPKPFIHSLAALSLRIFIPTLSPSLRFLFLFIPFSLPSWIPYSFPPRFSISYKFCNTVVWKVWGACYVLSCVVCVEFHFPSYPHHSARKCY